MKSPAARLSLPEGSRASKDTANEHAKIRGTYRQPKLTQLLSVRYSHRGHCRRDTFQLQVEANLGHPSLSIALQD
jgi:hypothetical protein